MRILQVFFYTALSIFLMIAGIPNEVFYFGMPLAGLVSLIPFYLALSKCRSFRGAGLITSLLYGFVHIFSSFWLSNFKEYAVLTIGATSLYYFLTGYLSGLVYYIPFAFTKKKPCRHTQQSIGRIMFFACAWTLHEWGKSTGFLAYPWGTLILTAWNWKLITQIVALTGTWGISFLFSLFAATAAETVLWLPERKSLPKLYSKETGLQPLAYVQVFTLSLFALTLIYGTYQYLKPRIPVKSFNTVIVQNNTDSWNDSDEVSCATSIRLADEAIAASDLEPDAVILSECVITWALPDSWWYYDIFPEDESFKDGIRRIGVPFIFGAAYVKDADEGVFENSAVIVDSDADIVDHYAKIHLVPFAEEIPFQDKPWMQVFMQNIAGFSRGWSAGTKFTLFTVQGTDAIKVSAPVCFEDAFPDVCRKLFLAGSEVYVNLTNDSWSHMKSSEYQHFVIASYRAIENRTTLVRSTQGGYSVVTDPAGRILADLPLFEPASVLTEIPVYEREITTYAWLGDWVPLFAGILLLICFIQLRKKIFQPIS